MLHFSQDNEKDVTKMKKILLYGDINVNCYLIEHHQKCYIIDPGYQKERLIDYVNEHQLEVLGILLTHAHLDHIGAIDAFDVPVYLHENEFEIITDNVKNGFSFFGKEMPYDLSSIHLVPLHDGQTLALDDLSIEVIHTPGHTVGCVCYKVENDLYTGDTLFKGTVGRWDFPTGHLQTLQQSVVSLIDSQEDNITIHPAHGDSSTIAAERRTNPFYLEWA